MGGRLVGGCLEGGRMVGGRVSVETFGAAVTGALAGVDVVAGMVARDAELLRLIDERMASHDAVVDCRISRWRIFVVVVGWRVRNQHLYNRTKIIRQLKIHTI